MHHLKRFALGVRFSVYEKDIHEKEKPRRLCATLGGVFFLQCFDFVNREAGCICNCF